MTKEFKMESEDTPTIRYNYYLHCKSEILSWADIEKLIMIRIDPSEYYLHYVFTKEEKSCMLKELKKKTYTDIQIKSELFISLYRECQMED